MQEKSLVANESVSLFQVPAPQRVNVLLVLSVWLWYGILRFLSAHHIDVISIIQTRTSSDMRQFPTHSQLLRNTKAFAIKLSKIIFPCHLITAMLFIISHSVELGPLIGTMIHVLPLFQFALIVTLIVQRSEIILYCSKRLPLIESDPRPLRNVYILLSDSLTSFTRPLIDFTLFTSLLFGGPMTHFDLFISALPSLVRVFQCLREFSKVDGAHLLANMFKYSCNIPILACTWYSRVDTEASLKQNFLTLQMWLMLLNSCYTFFWDVRMDWRITSLTKIRKTTCALPSINYQLAIIFDFMIRFWWIWIALYTQDKTNRFVFFDGELHYLEIIRRALWAIFKLESEYTLRSVSKA
ncbi:hypothetical protein KAFR_0E03370 [Kazachstania africana CBS 2517]|uniref:EXS domain-containing protein n=1 Tax=Kazachstania africana (strain ATCC 22294 / BCRC 22015 / CBS 2517 / CECT 1963 / NBRC 1671 / NRRL Y-8276) TaxID=1071382 RepID=H2AVT9_KAZAF|nr:hypothetical protein KAFR_0E03370 [Kazachstania africana CBS 2517]CCF58489.1 hypothetical protein KAFR_0E03370 [Kazachstania africana CBS 2517]